MRSFEIMATATVRVRVRVTVSVIRSEQCEQIRWFTHRTKMDNEYGNVCTGQYFAKKKNERFNSQPVHLGREHSTVQLSHHWYVIMGGTTECGLGLALELGFLSVEIAKKAQPSFVCLYSMCQKITARAIGNTHIAYTSLMRAITSNNKFGLQIPVTKTIDLITNPCVSPPHSPPYNKIGHKLASTMQPE